jgi:hypothetical protein
MRTITKSKNHLLIANQSTVVISPCDEMMPLLFSHRITFLLQLCTLVQAFPIYPTASLQQKRILLGSRIYATGRLEEIEEIWRQAAATSVEDALRSTAEFVQDEAFSYRKRVTDRIHREREFDDTKRVVDGIQSISPKEDPMMFDDFLPFAKKNRHPKNMAMPAEMKFESDYREALVLAEDKFLRCISKAEERLAQAIHRSEAAYDRLLQREKHWTFDVVLRAKMQYIQSIVAAEELFQIAVERAELGFEESKIKAAEMKNVQRQYYHERGEFMPDEIKYLSTYFANLIAF